MAESPTIRGRRSKSMPNSQKPDATELIARREDVVPKTKCRNEKEKQRYAYAKPLRVGVDLLYT